MLAGVGTSVGPLCRERDLPDLTLVEDLLLVRLRWRRRTVVVVRRNAFFGTRCCFKSKKRSFCQDRLGTSIGKVEKKREMRSLLIHLKILEYGRVLGRRCEAHRTCRRKRLRFHLFILCLSRACLGKKDRFGGIKRTPKRCVSHPPSRCPTGLCLASQDRWRP